MLNKYVDLKSYNDEIQGHANINLNVKYNVASYVQKISGKIYIEEVFFDTRIDDEMYEAQVSGPMECYVVSNKFSSNRVMAVLSCYNAIAGTFEQGQVKFYSDRNKNAYMVLSYRNQILYSQFDILN